MKYFVSFVVQNSFGPGFGNTVVGCTEPIESTDDIRKIEKVIDENIDIKNATILSINPVGNQSKPKSENEMSICGNVHSET